MGCLPQAAWPELLSEKSGRCGITRQIGRGALPMIDHVVISVRQSIRYGNIEALPGAGYGQFEHKADSLIAKFKEAEAERSERLMYEQSHRDYLRSGYLHHVCLSWAAYQCYRDNAITHRSPARQKCQRTEAGKDMTITDMQMRRVMFAALDAKYTEGLADAKAENDALRDDVAAGRRRTRIKQSVDQCVCKPHHPASSVDSKLPPTGDTAERDYFTLREADHYAKNNWKEPRSILMSSADRVALIDGQLMQLL